MEAALENKWKEVVKMYESNPGAHTATFTEANNTALHLAVDLNREEVVKMLVDAVIEYEKKEDGEFPASEEALRVRNINGDTPLHIAASRGFTNICICIIGENIERKNLLRLENYNGETPLFLAAFNWKKSTFAYLSEITELYQVGGDQQDQQPLLRDFTGRNGDTILHCAINRDYFDLALIIVHKFDFLKTAINGDGQTPLHVLATRPSAFKSTNKPTGWRFLLYEYGDHDVEKAPSSKSSSEKRGTTNGLFLFFDCIYKNSVGRLTKWMKMTFKEILDTKKKHRWSGQLLDELMKDPAEALTGRKSAGVRPESHKPPYTDWEEEFKAVEEAYERFKGEIDPSNPASKDKDAKTDDTKGETAYLAAARHGIVEMVIRIQRDIPSVIHSTNSKKQNALLVAVKHRQSQVVKALKKESKYEKYSTNA
ncbi:hypothetical protein PIB30_041877 [Stylosanthes scabra]|uniref:Uncharacterized protein n=1 Tax=Stylosanthes scabra TaxID=79078 RepID=A0ABU6WD54_9FABA|nr:hypothetical protein [Stylosanthes scabra]